MIHQLSKRANFFRSLLFLSIVTNIVACASVTPTPLPPPTPTQVAIVVPTTPPATTTSQPTATTAPSNTPSPSNTPVPSDTPAPTDTATRVPPTKAPPTATAVPPANNPTNPPAAQPTAPAAPAPPVAPPASFAPTDLVYIPAGLLKMGGSAPGDSDDEKPYHHVNLDAYNIEKYEVTNSQYQACVAAKVCAAPVKASSYTRPSYFGDAAFANYPVINVTWTDADTYCKWIGRRLPNEAEWERAAKGDQNWRYTWSNSIGMHFEWNAIFHGSPISFCEASCPLPTYWTDVNDGFADTAPVGQFGQYDSSSGFGVIDMAGNVSEWTNNWYDGNAYHDGNDVNGPSDPTGTKTVRGGSWADEPTRNSDRNPVAPDQASDRIGFRCAQ